MKKQNDFLNLAENLLAGMLSIVQQYNTDNVILPDFPDSSDVDENVSALQVESIKEEETYLNLKEACEFLGIAESTCYQRISRGEIPNFKKGRRLYFKRLELIKYVESGRRKTAEDIDAMAEQHLRNFQKRS